MSNRGHRRRRSDASGLSELSDLQLKKGRFGNDQTSSSDSSQEKPINEMDDGDNMLVVLFGGNNADEPTQQVNNVANVIIPNQMELQNDVGQLGNDAQPIDAESPSVGNNGQLIIADDETVENQNGDAQHATENVVNDQNGDQPIVASVEVPAPPQLPVIGNWSDFQEQLETYVTEYPEFVANYIGEFGSRMQDFNEARDVNANRQAIISASAITADREFSGYLPYRNDITAALSGIQLASEDGGLINTAPAPIREPGLDRDSQLITQNLATIMLKNGNCAICQTQQFDYSSDTKLATHNCPSFGILRSDDAGFGIQEQIRDFRSLEGVLQIDGEEQPRNVQLDFRENIVYESLPEFVAARNLNGQKQADELARLCTFFASKLATIKIGSNPAKPYLADPMSRLMYILPPKQILAIVNSDEFVPAPDVTKWLEHANEVSPNSRKTIFYARNFKENGDVERVIIAIGINDDLDIGHPIPLITITSRLFSQIGYFESLEIMEIIAGKEWSQDCLVFTGRYDVATTNCVFCNSSPKCTDVDECEDARLAAVDGFIFTFDVAMLVKAYELFAIHPPRLVTPRTGHPRRPHQFLPDIFLSPSMYKRKRTNIDCFAAETYLLAKYNDANGVANRRELNLTTFHMFWQMYTEGRHIWMTYGDDVARGSRDGAQHKVRHGCITTLLEALSMPKKDIFPPVSRLDFFTWNFHLAKNKSFVWKLVHEKREKIAKRIGTPTALAEPDHETEYIQARYKLYNDLYSPVPTRRTSDF